ncbi:Enoyl-[acyl-carrier-protein] reductase [NADH] [hydrothermal vent metagenome]|uniref:Enoyl-[acyl-carrier-protein] reductase [NADH] n=1 Tax=hydrothermal vent metagenome TaxID=652676 RepID=A0A3B1C0E5_9ZZZZ
MELMKGKKGLVVGIANERSLAWGISQALHREGADLAFTYASQQFEKRVRPLAELLGSSFVHEMDVTDDEAMDRVFEAYKNEFGQMDFLVHGVAFSDKGELKGPYYQTSRENFLMTMDVSVYSFTAMARRAQNIMPDGGAMLTLTYYGAQKAVPNYNVMGVAKAGLEASVRYLAVDLGQRGIRVNAISAGPVKTLASSGVANFKDLMRRGVEGSPMKRNVTIDEVGNAALYLLSGLSTATTGEVLFVDAGFQASVG